MGCPLEIPYSSFKSDNERPSPVDALKLPADMYMLPDMALSEVPDWFILYGFCKCGYFRGVDIQKTRKKFSASSRTSELARFLHCKRCGRKGDNRFTFKQMLRVGLEKSSMVAIPCEPSGDEADMGDHDPCLG